MPLFDNFLPTTRQQQVTPATPSTDPAQQSAANNPTVPSAANTPIAAQSTNGVTGSESPLAKFDDLWKNDPNAAKPAEPFSFNSDPTKLMDAAKTVDFMKVLTPELQQRVNAGGADGQKAMMEAMNSVAQMTYAQSAHASSKIVETALQASEDRFKAMLPDIIRQHTVTSSIRETNPLISNPAMAPMVDALQQQFTRKFPQATATEIQSHVNEFLNGAADMITSQRPKPVDTKSRAQQDWSMFIPE